MDGKAYKQIIRSELLPSAYTLFPDDNYIFQQDNDPKHTSTIVRDYMDEIGLVRTAWPAQSPDLNPIENLWSIIDQATQFRAADTEEELFEILNEAWPQIPIELLNRLLWLFAAKLCSMRMDLLLATKLLNFKPRGLFTFCNLSFERNIFMKNFLWQFIKHNFSL